MLHCIIGPGYRGGPPFDSRGPPPAHYRDDRYDFDPRYDNYGRYVTTIVLLIYRYIIIIKYFTEEIPDTIPAEVPLPWVSLLPTTIGEAIMTPETVPLGVHPDYR